ncbi:MAG: hypothetical protein RMJ00_00605 [Nitrososphaerota archaeon]|nr:hypothetical protein [Candidatus Bathyarchaeota archaeon]MCX8162425.1 hypothetical protein [Candidatus Bathyarchaeota archaeon]MDW8061190.1 hypothetical protein [Nitrososphaerota archaeon]
MLFKDRMKILYRIAWEAGITRGLDLIPLTPTELRCRLEESITLRDASKYWIKIA